MRLHSSGIKFSKNIKSEYSTKGSYEVINNVNDGLEP